MNKTLLAAALAAVSMPILTAACAHAPAPKKAMACNPQPQWFTNDAQGHPTNAVFICFGDKGELLWSSRPLTAQEAAMRMESLPMVQVPVTVPVVEPAPIAKTKVDPALLAERRARSRAERELAEAKETANYAMAKLQARFDADEKKAGIRAEVARQKSQAERAKSAAAIP